MSGAAMREARGTAEAMALVAVGTGMALSTYVAHVYRFVAALTMITAKTQKGETEQSAKQAQGTAS